MMRRMRNVPLLLLLAAACAAPPSSGHAMTVFEASSVEVDGARYPFQLLHPAGRPSGPEPLVVFLHGAGERGKDNSRQLTWLPLAMASDSFRERFPCWLLAVQCPEDEKWADVPWSEVMPSPLPKEPTRAVRAVLAAMERVQREHAVDPDRVYLTGLSMGGYGAWDLAMREPHRFAALLPVCGGGDPASVERLRGLPIWIWHGDRDAAVPVVRSRQMAEALQKASIEASYSELPGVGHDSWRQAYGPDGALEWMFSQRRGKD